MALLNVVQLIGTVVNETILPNTVPAEKTDGKKSIPVLNFWICCPDEEKGEKYFYPVAVWGQELVEDCCEHLKQGAMVYVQGELRIKYHFNHELKKRERSIETVKALKVEFLSKKLKDEIDYSLNEIKLIGNLVEDPVQTEDGFVVAVDRMYPSKELKVPNYKLTDYVTLILSDKSVMNTKLQKGSPVFINGKLMKRKHIDDQSKPKIVVEVKHMVGR